MSPAISSRRFFELDHEILHTYSGRHYLKLEEGGFLIFCLGGRLFGVPAGVLDPGGGQNPDISTAKPQIKNPPSSSFRYRLPEYVCKISWSNSKKRREEFPGTQFWAFNLNQPVRYISFSFLCYSQPASCRTRPMNVDDDLEDIRWIPGLGGERLPTASYTLLPNLKKGLFFAIGEG